MVRLFHQHLKVILDITAAAKEPTAPRRGRRRSTEQSGRDALLHSARPWFARHGFEGTSLRALAADAGVDMALVSRVFGSKAELWNAVIEQLVEQQTSRYQDLDIIIAQSAVAPADAFKAFIQHFTAVSFTMPEFPALLVQEAANPGPRLELILTRLVFPFRAYCDPIITAAEKAGVIRVLNRELFFNMLLSSVALPMASPSMFSGVNGLTVKLRDMIADEAIRIFIR
jgi:AcrR family transcriptional regulator